MLESMWSYVFVSNSFIQNLVITFHTLTACSNAEELCVLLVCHTHHGGVGCRSSITTFCYFPSVNWKRVKTDRCGTHQK